MPERVERSNASVLDRLPPGGPAVGDYNRDGYPDVFVPVPEHANESLNEHRRTSSRLYLNHGSARGVEGFVDVTDVAGVGVAGATYAAAWGEANGDGRPDLFVGGYGQAALFVADGLGGFDRRALPVDDPGFVVDASWGDVDADGDLDLAIARFTAASDDVPQGELVDQPGAENLVLENTPDGFVDATDRFGSEHARRSTSVGFVDLDAGGRQELFVTNYGEANALWEATGQGGFVDRAAALGLADGARNTCQAFVDLDRDGDLDVFVTRQEGARHAVYEHRTPGGEALADREFVDRSGSLPTNTTTERAWGCAGADWDNDGDVDLFTGSGQPGTPVAQRDRLLANQARQGQPWTFEDVTLEAGDHDVDEYEHGPTIAIPRATGGLAVQDVNLGGSGAVDVFASHHGDDRLRLYRNVGWSGGWAGGNGDFLRVVLDGPDANPQGLGARVTVHAGELTVTRQVSSTSSFGGEATARQVFGVHKPIEAGFERQKGLGVTVAWPDGTERSYTDVFSIDRAVRLSHSGGYANDTVAPQPSLRLVDGEKGANGWYTSEEVTLELTARDGFAGGSRALGIEHVEYSRDGRSWTELSAPLAGESLSFEGEGTHPLWVRTADRAGNEAVFVLPVRIDGTQPSGELSSPTQGSVYAQGERQAEAPGERTIVVQPAAVEEKRVALPATRVGVDGREVTVNGEDPVPGPTPAPGLVPEPPVDESVTMPGVDAKTPDPSVLDPVEAEGQPVVANVTDATSGVNRVVFEVHNASGALVAEHTATRWPFAWSWPANVPAGEYEITAHVGDRAGNAVELQRRVLVAASMPDALESTVTGGPSLSP